jgi:hypothetical protein
MAKKKQEIEVKKGSIYEAAKLKVSQAQALTNYSGVLSQLQTFQVTDSNITEADGLRKKGDTALKQLVDLYKSDIAQVVDTKAQKDLAWSEVINPFQEAQSGLKDKIKAKRNTVAKEVEVRSAEYAKDDQTKAKFFSFINEKSTELSATTTVDEIVLIEKRLGSEKSKKSQYSGLFEGVDAVISIMRPYMSARKEHVLLLEEAEIGGFEDDGPVVTEIKCNMKAEMLEMMTKCTDYINTLNTPEVELDIDGVGGRTLFRFEIIDEAKLMKKHPELFAPVPARVMEFAKTLKELTPKSLVDSYESDGLKTFYIKSL